MDIRSVPNLNAATAAHIDKGALSSEMPGASARPVAEPTQAVAAVQQPAPTPRAEQITQALKDINQALESSQARNLEFSVDEESSRTIVKVVDRQTHEVIRQMPTQEALEIAKSLDKAISLLARQKA